MWPLLRKPVLAEIPARRPGSRPGALNRAELEAYSALAEALPDSEVVLTTGPAGSSVALGLVAAATARGTRAALVECDFAEPVLAETLGVSRAPGFREYLRGEAQPAEILQALVPAGPASGAAAEHLTCVVAGSASADAAALLASDRCRDAIARLRGAYELIVLDGPPLTGEPRPLEALASSADKTIVCGRRVELPKRPPIAGAKFVVVG